LLSTPKILQGFHATPKALNTDKKWIMAVIAGDVFISAKSTEANGILMDAETADELKFFCQRRLQLGQWIWCRRHGQRRILSWLNYAACW
jgi:hypothetical protein